MANPKKPAGAKPKTVAGATAKKRSRKSDAAAARPIVTPQLTTDELEALRQRLQRKYR